MIRYIPAAASWALADRIVRVYRNLNRNCYSVQEKNPLGGAWRVIAHVDSIELRNCRFAVSAASRARVLRQKRRNVHAFVYGTVGAGPVVWSRAWRVKYDPFTWSTFVTEDGAPVHEALFAHFGKHGALALLTLEGRPTR